MAKRAFDLFFSSIGLLMLAPLLLAIALVIKITSPGPVFYRGQRMGRGGKPFGIYKFRSMVVDGEKRGPVATPEGDPRVTPIGAIIRKYKLDELPQLINVFVGDMSLVGPRPEAALYFEFYSEEDRNAILSVRPGMTDYGSLYYHDEGKLLTGSTDPVKTYVEKVLPHKLPLQLRYIREQSIWVDFKIILQTIGTIFVTRLSGKA